MSTRPQTLFEPYKAALQRLIQIALGDTGQSRKVANFLLAWWNASENGGFDLVELWAVDQEIAHDMISICRVIAAYHCYPDTLGYKKEFQAIWELWRKPEVLEAQKHVTEAWDEVIRNAATLKNRGNQ